MPGSTGNCNHTSDIAISRFVQLLKSCKTLYSVICPAITVLAWDNGSPWVPVCSTSRSLVGRNHSDIQTCNAIFLSNPTRKMFNAVFPFDGWFWGYEIKCVSDKAEGINVWYIYDDTIWHAHDLKVMVTVWCLLVLSICWWCVVNIFD